MLTINDLPDDVLLLIFDFNVVRYQILHFLLSNKSEFADTKSRIESWWQALVHVCRRWRGVVFGSPRRLDLQLCCNTSRLFSRKLQSLDVWPALPLFILGCVYQGVVDDSIAAFEHRDRIRQINFDCLTKNEKFWTAMQVPFPELTNLCLLFDHWRPNPRYGPVLPDSFLGGSAPRLRYFHLEGIPFPGLPKLLLSTTHLVELNLCDIPHSGYISPEAMAACLSMLTSLRTLRLGIFESPPSLPDQENRRLRSPPPTRSILPALTFFSFRGTNEYLEEFVVRIDTPQLSSLRALFDNTDIELEGPELKQFIGRTPALRAHEEARHPFLNSKT